MIGVAILVGAILLLAVAEVILIITLSILRAKTEKEMGKILQGGKLDKGAYVPIRAYASDAGLDLRSPKCIIVPAHSAAVIDTGVHVDLPYGTVGLLKSRSGLNVKHGITSEGVIDSGYTGSIIAKLYNHSDKDYTISRGDKITQLLVVECLLPEVQVVEEDFVPTERGTGDFGSTGR